MLRGASVLLFGNALLATFNILRTVALARLLPLEDFGVASTFSILLTAMSMGFGFNFGQALIRVSHDEQVGWQPVLQFLHFLLGFVLFLVFAIFAPIFSGFLGSSEATWAYVLFSVVPLMIGLTHFDIYRKQRAGNFFGISIYNSVPVVLSTLLVWPAFLIFRDWRVMPLLLTFQVLLSLLVSHLVAETPYRFGRQSQTVASALKFGLPLFCSSILVFFVTNGDRLVVSIQFGLDSLAVFSVAFMVVFAPVSLLIGTLNSFFLSVLSVRSKNQKLQLKFFVISLQVHAIFAMGTAIFYSFFDRLIIVQVFGETYISAVDYLFLIGVLQSFRLIFSAATPLLLTRGRTNTLLFSTIIRFVAVPVGAYLVVYVDFSILGLIGVGILGEIAAGLFCLWSLSRIFPLKDFRLFVNFVLPFAVIVFVLFSHIFWTFEPSDSGFVGYFVFSSTFVSSCVVFALMRDLREELWKRLRSWSDGG